MRRISKIRFDKERVTIVYEKRAMNGHWDKNTLTSSDEPSVAFQMALFALAEPGLQLMDLPATSGMRVIGISLKYSRSSDVIVGAHIIGKRFLTRGNSEIGLKIPVLFVRSAKHDFQDALLRDLVHLLEVMLSRGEKYLEGKERTQGDLFDDDRGHGDASGAPAGDDATPPADDDAYDPDHGFRESKDDAPGAPAGDDASVPPAAPLPDPAETYRYLFGEAGEDDGDSDT